MSGSGRRVLQQVLIAAAGAGAMIVGLTALLADLLSGRPTAEFAGAAAVATAGGAALVFLRRMRLRPSAGGTVVVALTAAAGSLAGLLRSVETLGGMYAYHVGRGYPFTWLRRGATAETPAEAEARTLDKPWNVHGDVLAVNLAVWALAGVLVVVLVALVRRAVRPVAVGANET